MSGSFFWMQKNRIDEQEQSIDSLMELVEKSKKDRMNLIQTNGILRNKIQDLKKSDRQTDIHTDKIKYQSKKKEFKIYRT